MAQEKKKKATEKGKKTELKEEKKIVTLSKMPAETFDPHRIIRTPLSTEKSIRKIEFENTLVFVVDPQATKQDIKRAVETLFKVKVAKVNTQNAFIGEKRAYVKLAPSSVAADVSADLGLI